MVGSFERILLPVGLRSLTPRLVDSLTHLASGRSVQVTLLHVVETIDDGEEDDEDLDDFYEDLKQRAQSELDTFVRHLAARGIQPQIEITIGQRVSSVIRYASREQFDLIVIEPDAINPESPQDAFTSRAHQVSVLAPCPVLVIR